MATLNEGDIIELKAGHRVYADVPEHFVYGNRRGSFALAHHDVTIGGEFDYLAGRYVVYKTAADGSGYPGVHHVYCERLDDRVRVDFYQTGGFTAMVRTGEIEPVGRAGRRWVELEPADAAR